MEELNVDRNTLVYLFLPTHQIRTDIELDLYGVLGEDQLREVLFTSYTGGVPNMELQ